ncbi:helix-turn-helix domain-containing protein [Tenacibaculum agarivorans]|uniref:helix-turn-helix domain-containing protein n=1 Tax=Tenacibaculum agarivorans TaxID=1908389 RepID=UPI00094B7D28|nr:helix-turn-helix domain-containing protein [Tenacibaculum agarivorans]
MDIDKEVCNYIAKEWVNKSKSNRNFALDHNIDEKTVRKILQVNGYRMPLRTLYKICEARNIKLEEFFKLID